MQLNPAMAMEDGAFVANNSSMFSNMNDDLMDLLLDEGCWLQAANASNPWLSRHSNNAALMSYPHPESNSTLQNNSINLNSATQPSNAPEKQKQEEEMERWDLPGCTHVFHQNISEDLNSQPQIVKAPSQIQNPLWEGNRNRIWIGPHVDLGPEISVNDRLMKAIWFFKEMSGDKDMLIQIWLPERNGTRKYLITSEQPYYLDPASTHLINYRNVSRNYRFSTDEESKETLGMPGRVYTGKVPEWTPDVRFFRQDEYLRVGYARMYGVSGTIALPIFERGSGNCLGVLEIVSTKQKVKYHPEVENVCKALEAVDLRSSDITSPSEEKNASKAYEADFPTILNVLRTVCDKHGLPLAQTWALCIEHRKEEIPCSASIVSSAACYVRDPRVRDFHEACSEHHLLIGQGVVGKAFMTNQPCFAIDMTAFTKADYPLSHHAKLFALRGAVAIQVRSGKSRNYVLEFFLPTYHQDAATFTFHFKVVESLSKLTMQQSCRNLRFLTLEDLKQQPLFSVQQIPSSSTDAKLKDVNEGNLRFSSSGNSSQLEKSGDSCKMEVQKVNASLFREDKQRNDFKLMIEWGDLNEEPPHGGKVFTDDGHKGNAKDGAATTFSDQHQHGGGRKAGERKKTKTQKSISLQELRQYFAGSLKDAAKEIGVCPTTLKRICREHGIARWPSRKIKKVGHSLKKLQMVIDSVKGAEGSIQLSNFYGSFPALSSSNITKTKKASDAKANDASHPYTEAEDSIFRSGANTSKPQSPTSQTSTSTHSFSAQVTPMGNSTMAGNPGMSIERKNEAEVILHLEEPSQSNKSQGDNPLPESDLPHLPITTGFAQGDNLKRHAGALKVKVALGEEKVRFSIASDMGFIALQHEIARRFDVDDVNIHVKYLDNDKEWVLLTCDADLDECIDIQRLSGNHTIKLSVHRAKRSYSST